MSDGWWGWRRRGKAPAYGHTRARFSICICSKLAQARSLSQCMSSGRSARLRAMCEQTLRAGVRSALIPSWWSGDGPLGWSVVEKRDEHGQLVMKSWDTGRCKDGDGQSGKKCNVVHVHAICMEALGLPRLWHFSSSQASTTHVFPVFHNSKYALCSHDALSANSSINDPEVERGV